MRMFADYVGSIFCAITITLIRLVRKKKLLEWKTAAMDETKTDILPCVISAMIF